MAWFDATPHNARKSRRVLIGSELCAGAMPKIEAIDYQMLADIQEIGLIEYDAAGAKPVSWSTLNAWAAMTGARLTGGEASLLRILSEAYLNQYRAACSEGATPPDA